MRYLLTTAGNTFVFKESLRNDKFRWNPNRKVWTKVVEDDETAQAIISAYSENGLHIEVKPLSNPDEKKYFVKESWIFNLESMHDKLWVIESAIQTGELQFPFQLAGKNIKDYNDLEDLRQESYELEDKAKRGKVTGLQYGRIKAIVAWRVEQRYNACMAAGMNERDAGRCFEDM